jgi:hypothetical protein
MLSWRGSPRWIYVEFVTQIETEVSELPIVNNNYRGVSQSLLVVILTDGSLEEACNVCAVRKDANHSKVW